MNLVSKSMIYLSTERKWGNRYWIFRRNTYLNKAYKKVVSNKGVAGIDGITVEEEFDYLKGNKDRILNQIRKRRYKS